MPDRAAERRTLDGFVMITQDALLAEARNPDLPLWYRLVLLARARCRQNGHAEFAKGEVRRTLMVCDRVTGELRLPRSDTISKALAEARGRGLLVHDSDVRCLHVPPAVVQGGRYGAPDERCRTHTATPPPRRTLGPRPQSSVETLGSQPNVLGSPAPTFEGKAAGQRSAPLTSSHRPAPNSRPEPHAATLSVGSEGGASPHPAPTAEPVCTRCRHLVSPTTRRCACPTHTNTQEAS